MSDVSKDDYVFLPVDEATAPAKGGFFEHYVDAWWTVHPEHGLLFYNRKNPRTGRRRVHGLGSPQCNTDERITRKVGLDTAGSLWPDIRVEQFPSVWVPVNISDYRLD
jgi:hypothetical protein